MTQNMDPESVGIPHIHDVECSFEDNTQTKPFIPIEKLADECNVLSDLSSPNKTNNDVPSRPPSTKGSPCNDPRTSYTKDFEDLPKGSDMLKDLMDDEAGVDIEGNPPNPPVWMHVSKNDPKINGYFMYSSDEYDEDPLPPKSAVQLPAKRRKL